MDVTVSPAPTSVRELVPPHTSLVIPHWSRNMDKPMTSRSNTAPTRFVEAGGTRFAYRRFGDPIGTPIVLLQHFMGNLDNYDPAITDALAMGREVILTDNAGVVLSTGAAPETVAGMARGAASLIDALRLEHVDLFGFSMGGFVAQQIA